MKGQKWDNVFLSIIFQYRSTTCTDTIPAPSLLYMCIVVSSLSLFLNLTLNYLCVLIIIWVCDVLFFWKTYFCINLSYLPSLYLIVFFCCLLSIVSSSTSLHQKHIYSQHACKIHTFPLFMKIQICVF